MKDEKPINKEEIQFVSVHTGIRVQGLKETYIFNKHGRDKSKILNVMRIGSVLASIESTVEEAWDAIEYIKLQRERDGRRNK